MGIRDWFRPKWLHSNPRVRRKILGAGMPMPQLIKIALASPYADVWEMIVEKAEQMKEQEILFRALEMPDSYGMPNNRRIAVGVLEERKVELFERIKNEGFYHAYVFQGKDQALRRKASQCVRVEHWLAQIAAQADAADIRQDAVMRLATGEGLERALMNTLWPEIREKAASRMSLLQLQMALDRQLYVFEQDPRYAAAGQAMAREYFHKKVAVAAQEQDWQALKEIIRCGIDSESQLFVIATLPLPELDFACLQRVAQLPHYLKHEKVVRPVLERFQAAGWSIQEEVEYQSVSEIEESGSLPMPVIQIKCQRRQEQLAWGIFQQHP